MNKRKNVDELETDFSLLDKLSNKKYKIDDKWISGTSVANYLNGEPLIDWLDLYYKKYGYNEKRITRSILTNINNNFVKNKAVVNKLWPSDDIIKNKLSCTCYRINDSNLVVFWEDCRINLD